MRCHLTTPSTIKPNYNNHEQYDGPPIRLRIQWVRSFYLLASPAVRHGCNLPKRAGGIGGGSSGGGTLSMINTPAFECCPRNLISMRMSIPKFTTVTSVIRYSMHRSPLTKVLRNCPIASSYRCALEVVNELRRFSGNFAYLNRQ
jgi:hypothetical protein